MCVQNIAETTSVALDQKNETPSLLSIFYWGAEEEVAVVNGDGGGVPSLQLKLTFFLFLWRVSQMDELSEIINWQSIFR